MAKAAFNKKKTLFISKLDLNLRTKCKVLYLEYSFQWYLKLNISDSTSEIPGKCCNAVLVKDGDQLDRSCE